MGKQTPKLQYNVRSPAHSKTAIDKWKQELKKIFFFFLLWKILDRGQVKTFKYSAKKFEYYKP